MTKIFDKINLLKSTSTNDNLLINGNFDVWQRGSSFSNSSYTADRWYINIIGGVRCYRMNGGSLQNSTSFMRIETSINNSYGILLQPIEYSNILQLRGNYATVSFYAKCPSLNNNWNSDIYFKAYYSTIPDDALTNRIPIESSFYNNNILTNNIWNKYTKSFLVPNNASTLLIEFSPSGELLAGSTIDIAQVKLEQGSSATNLKPLSFNDELNKCQKYYQKIDVKLKAGTGFGSGSARKFGVSTPLPVLPRTSNPKISRLESESSDVLLSNISSFITNNRFLTVTADSTSPYSELSSVFLIEDEIALAKVPGPVSNVSISRTGTNIELSWSPALENNNSINSYSIYYGSDLTFINNILSVTGLSGTITGINEYSPYYIKILASNNIGTGIVSNTYISGPLVSVPSGVQSVAGYWTNNISNLSWTPPINNGGSAVTGYVIQRSMYPSYSNIDSSFYTQNTNISLATNSVSQITSTGTYYFKIGALNIAGTGELISLSLPKTTPSPPRNLSTLSENGKVTLTYNEPSGNGGDTISQFNLQYSTSSGFVFSTGVSYSANYAPIVLNSLANNTTYYFKIRSYNNLGYGPYSETVSTIVNRTLTVPGSPTGLTSSWTNNYISTSGISDVFNVKWESPLDDGGTPIINYSIFLASDSSFATGIGTYTTINNNKNIDIVSPTGYSTIYIRAKANNSIGSSSYSSGISIPDSIPSAPYIKNIIPGDTAAVLTYIPPTVSNGAAITGYTIQYSTGLLFNSSISISESINNCNAYNVYCSGIDCYKTISNLVNNLKYYFRIAAINNIGTGLFSNIISTTPVVPTYKPSAPTIDSILRLQVNKTTNINSISPIILNSNPGNMTAYKYSGRSLFAIPVSGNNSGSIYGCNWYADQSTISKAAVHNGILASGQTGTLYLHMQGGVIGRQYVCTRNGITSEGPVSSITSYKFVNMTECNNNAASIYWNTPTNIGSPALTGYLIQTASDINFSNNIINYIIPSIDGLNHIFCAPTGEFRTRIAAVNSVGTGEWSVSTFTNSINFGAPDTVTNFTANTGSMSGNSCIVNLNWTPPINYGGTNNLSNYRVSLTLIKDTTVPITTTIYPSNSATSAQTTVTSNGTYQADIQSYNGYLYSNVISKGFSVSTNLLDSPASSWVFIPGGPSQLLYPYVLLPGLGSSKIPIVSNPTQSNLSNGANGWVTQVPISESVSGAFISADFGRVAKVRRIVFGGIPGFSNTLLNGSIFQGSNDNNNWNNILTISPSILPPQDSYTTYSIDNSYRYIRLFTPYNYLLNNTTPYSYLHVSRLTFI